MLQCDTVWCNVLRCVAGCCSTWQYVAICCGVYACVFALWCVSLRMVQTIHTLYSGCGVAELSRGCVLVKRDLKINPILEPCCVTRRDEADDLNTLTIDGKCQSASILVFGLLRVSATNRVRDNQSKC